jgi:DNA-binding HxlR family transcriptional regulator
MLTAQLRELEADGLVSRTVFADTPKARGLGRTMEALTAWWNKYGKSVPPKPG